MDYCLIAFSSSSGAIQAQRVLKGHVAFQTMPVLREISASCGIALRLPPEGVEAAAALLGGSELRPGEFTFYAVTGQGPGLTAEPIH